MYGLAFAPSLLQKNHLWFLSFLWKKPSTTSFFFNSLCLVSFDGSIPGHLVLRSPGHGELHLGHLQGLELVSAKVLRGLEASRRPKKTGKKPANIKIDSDRLKMLKAEQKSKHYIENHWFSI